MPTFNVCMTRLRVLQVQADDYEQACNLALEQFASTDAVCVDQRTTVEYAYECDPARTDQKIPASPAGL